MAKTKMTPTQKSQAKWGLAFVAPTMIGLLVLTVFLLVVDRTCFRIRKKDIWVFLLFAVFKILSDLFLFKAQVLIHLSLSAVLQLTSPYWVLVFCVILFHERVTFRKVFAICMAFFGCMLVTGILSEDISFDTLGITFALLSGFAYATYTVGNKVLMDRGYSYNTVLFFIFLLSTLVLLLYKLKDRDAELMAKCNAGKITREECEAQLSRKY